LIRNFTWTAVFKETRVPIQTLFDYVEESSLEKFLKGFPSVLQAGRKGC
jgi:hypothetical protein